MNTSLKNNLSHRFRLSSLTLVLNILCLIGLNAQQGNWVYVHNGNNCNSTGTSGSCMEARHEASYVESGEYFYLLGGREHNSNVNIYDPIQDSWTIGSDPPIGLHHFQAIDYQGLILALGAMTGNYPNEDPIEYILVYDPLLDLWFEGPPIPTNRLRGSAGVVEHNEKLYLVSGIQNGHVSGWVPWLDEYDPLTNSWTILPDAPHSRDHFHAVVANDKIYAGGGRRSGENGTFDGTEPAVDIYNLSNQSWSTNPNDIPTERAAPCVALLGNQILYIGGEKNAGDANDETEALNVNNGQWSTLDDLNTGRHGTQAIVNNSNVWVASGSPNRGGGTTTTHEKFYFTSSNDPILTANVKSTLNLTSTIDSNSGDITIEVSNTGGNQAILITNFDISGVVDSDMNFPFDFPYIMKVGESFTVFVTPPSGSDNSIELDVLHTGNKGEHIITTNCN